MDDTQRDQEHTEQHGEGDNIASQTNESPDVEVNVETPADRQEDAERTVDRMDKK